METYTGQSNDASLGRTARGGDYIHSGYYFPVSYRGNLTSTTFSSTDVGGRVQLYIK